METKQVISFSGGKDSTAMLLMMLEKEEQIDDVIFFDGGWDWPQMYDHIAKVEENTGIKITRVKPEKSFNYWFYEHKFSSRTHGEYVGYGWPGATCRWCTREKMKAIKQHKKTLGENITDCIGYAVGEEKRADRNKAKNVRYPLIEYNMDELDCLKYCYDMGYDWSGLYNYFTRVSCYVCPLQCTRELVVKKRHFPEQYQTILDMDAKIIQIRKDLNLPPPPEFKEGKTIQQIDAKIRGRNE